MLQEMYDFNDCATKALEFAKQNNETLVLVTADHATGELTMKEGNPDKKPKMEFLGNKHTSEMVPIFSYGPGSNEFSGIMENTDIFFRMRALLGL